MSIGSVLIVGGYGVVGTQIAGLIRSRYPKMEILLGGRNPGDGRKLAEKLGNAKSVKVDLAQQDPLSDLNENVDAVIAVVNDTDDHLLLSAVRNHIPCIDITRWTERMRSAILRMSVLDVSKAPLIFASSWMAAVVGTLARGLSEDYDTIEKIEINILYALQDNSGPNSVEYMDRMALPFEVTEGGKQKLAYPFKRAQKVNFPGTGTYKLYRFDCPDQFTLPMITNAQSVSARIGYDDHTSGPLLSLLVRSGLWGLISGPRFRKFRQGLLYNPGDGAPHRVRLDIEGKSGGKRKKCSWLITDPAGQTHLTATGAIIQLDRIIQAREMNEICSGVQVAEASTDLASAGAILTDVGIEVREL